MSYLSFVTFSWRIQVALQNYGRSALNLYSELTKNPFFLKTMSRLVCLCTFATKNHFFTLAAICSFLDRDRASLSRSYKWLFWRYLLVVLFSATRWCLQAEIWPNGVAQHCLVLWSLLILFFAGAEKVGFLRFSWFSHCKKLKLLLKASNFQNVLKMEMWFYRGLRFEKHFQSC